MRDIKSILLIISGSVAAYKSLDLIRKLSAHGIKTHAILTKGGQEFITPLAVSSLTGTKTYTDLFSLTDEVEMGHIELSRMADAVLVAPASAHLLAQMAHGLCDDLASTALLATNKPVFIAPAMNHKMWEHPATQRNIAQLEKDGVTLIAPEKGDMACGEFGVGRLAEIQTIIQTIFSKMAATPPSTITPHLPLHGRHAIVTSGPTYEPIDPVRFLGNYSSGKQGHTIAEALANLGARVTLVAGKTSLPTPAHTLITTVSATTAQAMYDAVMHALPADIFVGAAAVADWQLKTRHAHKVKKEDVKGALTLSFTPTKDILHAVATHKQRPDLVVGFAAETKNLEQYAKAKRAQKQVDWIVANNVSQAVFGADENEVLLFKSDKKAQHLPRQNKQQIADFLANEIANYFTKNSKTKFKTPSKKMAK